MFPFHIVLFEPEIPQNTGTIGRMCVSTGTDLHLIEPLGFTIDDAHLRRAGLDYWQYLSYRRYPDWDAFLEANPDANLYFFSTHGVKSYWDERYEPGDWLVFGRETSGLPLEFYERYRERLRIIPMPGEHSRSLNLANSVSIVLYEAMRQQAKGFQK
ncbi:MAG: tRNA (cytidine(34)-2'-O)-methyltransferase [Victivallaceae bacterium]|nr:tRNA (cytidine(34)-2'-O)-methyltransferase [Victivallaceae bacterium]